MRHKLSFIMTLIILIMNIQVLTPHAETSDPVQTSESASEGGAPQVSAASAIVMDAKTGQILYEKDAHSKRYPASITKIMTVLLALENGDLDSNLTMSEDAVWGIERGSSHIALDVGEQITLKDALYAVMLVSANEAAWGVAEHIGGSLSGFCDMMNQKATDLGCENTHFVNANGLHDENHYTTAYDMALITREALKNDTFKEIAATTYYEIPPTNKNSEARNLWQDNKLLNEDSEYYYKYCKGGKTGYTDQSGGTLVTWAQKDGIELICVTLNASPSSGNYIDSAALFEYFFNNYSYISPLSDYEFSAEALTQAQNYLNSYYECENAGTLYLDVDNTKKVLLPYDVSKDDLTYTLNLDSRRINSSIVGDLVVSYGGKTYLTLPVTYSGYINSNDEEAMLEAYKNGTLKLKDKKSKHSAKPFVIILAVILVLGIVTFIYLRIKYIQRKREEYLRRRNKARKHNQRF